ncbi:hypothetical protein ACROYT_G033235 [Oculina patagonica]
MVLNLWLIVLSRNGVMVLNLWLMILSGNGVMVLNLWLIVLSGNGVMVLNLWLIVLSASTGNGVMVLILCDQPDEISLTIILPGVPSRSLDLARNSVLFSVDIAEYFEVENKLFDEEDGLMLLTAVSCSMKRDLNRIQCYFEV